MKNFINNLIDFLNNMFIRLNNKRNNFSEFISKLKNTRTLKITSLNTFKSYQNSIVSFIFFNFFIVQNTRNNLQTQIFY